MPTQAQPTISQALDRLSPSSRAYFVVSSLFGVDAQEEHRKYLPDSTQSQLQSLASIEFSPEFLKAYLKKMLDFQAKSYFLGIDESWLDKNPVLREISKKKLVRMSQYDDLLEVGKRELVAYLVKSGKKKTAELLAHFSKEIQEALIAELGNFAEGPDSKLDFGFIFDFSYANSNELFKQAGLYAKDQSAVQQLAQRLGYAEGQRLIAVLKK